jgi:type II secretory pathway component PulL
VDLSCVWQITDEWMNEYNPGTRIRGFNIPNIRDQNCKWSELVPSMSNLQNLKCSFSSRITCSPPLIKTSATSHNLQPRSSSQLVFIKHVLILRFQLLLGRTERRKILGRLRRRWEGNIKVDLWEVAWISLRIRTDDSLLRMRKWLFGFYKLRGISLLLRAC